MKHLIIIITLLCFVSGCKKDDKENLPYTEVYGTVVSTGSHNPVEGVRVSIWDGLPNTSLTNDEDNKGSGEYNITFTDANGNFHIGVNGNEPVLSLYKEGYIFEYSVDGASLGIAPLVAGKKYTDIIFNLDGIAHFNPILMNESNNNYDDSIIISVYSKWGNPYVPITYSGEGPHRYLYSIQEGDLILGDSYVKYKIVYQRNNKWNTIIDSVYVNLGEVYRDTIYY
jgi:hypothetical protein